MSHIDSSEMVFPQMQWSRENAEALVERFKHLFQILDRHNTCDEILKEVYRADVIFQDSFHHVQGLSELQTYFSSIYDNVLHCEFVFLDDWVREGDAMLTWQMFFRHRRLNNQKTITVEGATHIRFDSRIYWHRDYFDGGQLLYEQLPLIGGVIGRIKRHMSV